MRKIFNIFYYLVFVDYSFDCFADYFVGCSVGYSVDCFVDYSYPSITLPFLHSYFVHCSKNIYIMLILFFYCVIIQSNIIEGVFLCF